MGAGEKLPTVQVHLLILGGAGTAAHGHMTQVCRINQVRNRRGLPSSASQHQDGCLHAVECNGHGISPLAEEASSPYGATDRGRSSCPNQASHESIRYASATRVRSSAPGRCSNGLKQRPTRLREYSPCYPHATSGHTALQ